ncbi:TIR domain-containing protein [Frankia sp. R82]|uniref:nSTAND1 domain-containing NTPase n=1 Tax=Frankia sp. R82 TaxID=2950553 RepID=UPI002043D152|nr:TIR domain-containing protein [Frankia sp. R82]MCM3883195.1 TIR domain-containing protein [Frankia sp. R82]
MARVFISYARPDAAVGESIRRRMSDAGHHVFLDVDEDRGVIIGEEWEKRLYQELRAADALVAVITSRYAASSWCLAEVAVARSREVVLLPLLVEPGVTLPLLSSLHYLDYAADPQRAVGAVLDALVRIGLGSGRGWADGRNPYPGLEPFSDDRRAVFFGREDDTQRVLGSLAAGAGGKGVSEQSPILLITGQSGVGKSSLLRAGVRPSILDQPRWRALPVFAPGDDPIEALTTAFLTTSHRLNLGWRREDVRARLRDGRNLHGLVGEILAAPPATDHLLLPIDQFEELLVTTSVPRRTRFARLLVETCASELSSSRRLHIVATLRSEYEQLLRDDPALCALPVAHYKLEALSSTALRTVIEGPAREAGLQIDNGLLSRMVADTEVGTALPLLAFTLWKLAADLHRGDHITRGAYQDLGGVHGTIAGQADQALTAASQPDTVTEEQVIASLLRLVSMDEAGTATRGRVELAALGPAHQARLAPFVRQRLVITDVVDDRTVVRIAHDAFLTAWPPLAQQIGAQLDVLRSRSQIERDARYWREAGRPTSLLWTRLQLRSYLDRGALRVGPAATARPELSADAAEFLRAGVRRDRRLRARVMTALAALLVAALAAATVAIAYSRSALHERRLAVSRGLIQEAITTRQSDPRVSLLLSIEAYRIAPTVQARGNLLSAQATYYAATLAGGTDPAQPVHAVAYARPQVHRMATAGHDGVVRVWDTTDTQRPALAVLHHDTPVYTVAFSPDGRRLATGEQNGTVTLWDVEGQRQLRQSAIAREAVYQVAFSPGGDLLAVATGDGRLALLGTSRFEVRAQARVGPGPVETTAFNRDGTLLAAAGADDTISIFHTALLLATGPGAAGPGTAGPGTAGPGTAGIRPEPTVLGGHTGTARSLAFSSAADVLAVGSDDRTVRLWAVADLRRPTVLATFVGHAGPVNAIAFAPDGRELASGGDDGSVRVWDVGARAELIALAGPSESVLSLAFSADGRTLAGSGSDGVTGLWHVSGPIRRDLPPIAGSVALAHSTASADLPQAALGSSGGSGTSGGQLAATAGADRTIRLWQTDPPAYLGALDPTSLRPVAAALSPPTAPAPATPVPATPVPPAVPVPPAAASPLAPASSDPQRDVASVEGSWAAYALAFDRDGTRLAVSQAGRVAVVDLQARVTPTVLIDPAPRTGIEATDVAVNAVDVSSSDGRLVIGGTDNAVRLGDPATGRLDQVLYRHESPVNAVRFTPDGRTVASASDDGLVTLHDVGRGAARRVDLRGPGPMKSLAISSDGRLLASGSDDGSVGLWMIDRGNAGRLLRTLRGGDQAVISMAFSPDASLVAGAGVDGSIRLWNTRTGALYAVLGGRDASAVAFSADGHELLTTDHDGTLMTWWIDPERVVSALCAPGRAMGRSEWARYLPTDDYRPACR